MADPQPPPARAGIAGWRGLLLLALAVLVPAVAGIVVWRAADDHKVVPGIDGCSHVRQRDAQLGCYSDEFGELVREDGRARALRTVDAKAADSIELGSDCHLAWHPIGERAGAADAAAGRDYDNIAAKTTCQQGYSHGYTIGFMGAREPTVAELVRIVRDECGGTGGLNALFNCTHSYGHVIARRFEGDVAAGIDACGKVDYEALPGTDVKSPVPGERPPVLVGVEHQCLYGLYMETALLDVAGGDTTLDNCGTATSAAARKACYAYLPSRVNAIRGDLGAAGRACHELAPKGDLRDSCVKTFAMGLPSVERCTYLPAKVEQEQCRRVITIREQQDDLLEFASGDPDSFDANVRVQPEADVSPPDGAPAAPSSAPPAS
jgi:hypothetical protein